MNGDTRRIRCRLDELEVQRRGQILEQGKPSAERGRLDHQSVLVDEPEPGQSLVEGGAAVGDQVVPGDRKSTRLNSSHQIISYAVFCLKKKKAWPAKKGAY